MLDTARPHLLRGPPDIPGHQIAVQEWLAAFAAQRGWALPQMALAWLLSRKMTVSVIAGADTPEHAATNVTALDIRFSPEDLAEIDRITLVDEDRTTAPMLRRRWDGSPV